MLSVPNATLYMLVSRRNIFVTKRTPAHHIWPCRSAPSPSPQVSEFTIMQRPAANYLSVSNVLYAVSIQLVSREFKDGSVDMIDDDVI